jgi:hypothetical protein
LSTEKAIVLKNFAARPKNEAKTRKNWIKSKEERDETPSSLQHTVVKELQNVCRSIAAAVGAVVAQLEGGALGLLAVAHAVLAAAHLDLIEGAVGVLVVGAAVYGTLDAGVGLVEHSCFLLWLAASPRNVAFGALRQFYAIA